HLLVSQHYNAQRQAQSFAAMLAPHLDRHPVPGLDVTPAHHDTGEAAPTLDLTWDSGADGDAAVEYGALVAADAERRALLASAAAPRAIAATRVRGEPALRDGEPRDDNDDDIASAPWPRGRAGTAIGRAVHAALQHANFDDPGLLGALARM